MKNLDRLLDPTSAALLAARARPRWPRCWALGAPGQDLGASSSGRAQHRTTSSDLTDLSLEELMDMEVTIASRNAAEALGRPRRGLRDHRRRDPARGAHLHPGGAAHGPRLLRVPTG